MNNRIVEWKFGANTGQVTAGGQGQGESLKQLSSPMGLIINDLDDIYVADCINGRIMC
jgi:hypothetical protein